MNSAKFPMLLPQLSAFCIEVLDWFSETYSTPRFGIRRYPVEVQWKRDPKYPERLLRCKQVPSWLDQEEGSLIWSDWVYLRTLPSYAEVNSIIDNDSDLQRRIYAAYGCILDRVGWGDQTRDYILQNAIIEPLINHAKSFEYDSSVFFEVYSHFESMLLNLHIEATTHLPLCGFSADKPIQLSNKAVIDLVDDEAISSGINFGILNIHRRSSVGYLAIDRQFAVSRRVRIDIDDEFLTKPDFEDACRRLANPPDISHLRHAVTSALNLFDGRGIYIGQGWSVVRTSLGTAGSRDGMVYSIPSEFYRTVTMTSDDVAAFTALWHSLQSPLVQKHLRVALARYSSSLLRTSHDEAIVDLAIAAESLFGSRTPGEATFRVSLNAALFLGDKNWLPSDVRRFFRDVYRKRSLIVHGAPDDRSSKVEEARTMRSRLAEAIRASIFKAIDELEVNPHALDWVKLIDVKLDALAADDVGQ